LFALIPLLLTACAATPVTLPRMESVDLPRFMGDWYVIAHVPSRPERRAHNAIENYVLEADGTIRTTFRYRDAPAGRLKTMHPKARVVAETGNAVWGMQFIWPVRAEYVIAYVDAGYQETIVARSKRDYAWIMARTPTLPPQRYQALQARLARDRRAADDWSIRVSWPCACSTCTTLRSFLVSPDEQRREWPLAQDGRRHVEQAIRQAEAPVRCTTLTAGRPYTLVLTKTDEVHAADRRERSQAAEDLERISALWH